MKTQPYTILLISFLMITACNNLPSPFLARLDGETLHSIQGSKVHSPSWSPDGSKIAFTSTSPITGKSNIYILDINTLKISSLIEDEYFSVESWSIADEIALSGIGGIWTVAADSGTPIKVTSYGQSAAWAPFGRSLAIFQNTSSSGTRSESLHIVDLNQGIDTIIHTIDVKEEFAADNPSWSPDGTKVAFSLTVEEYDSGTNVYILELKDDKVIQLTNDKNYNRQPNWSPDNSLIAYLSSPPKSQATYIVFSNIDGTCTTKSENVGWVDIAWSPDGRFLAFTRNDSLYRLDLFQLFGNDLLQKGVICE